MSRCRKCDSRLVLVAPWQNKGKPHGSYCPSCDRHEGRERKEYVDRYNAPLVNPPITYGEWEMQRKERAKEESEQVEEKQR